MTYRTMGDLGGGSCFTEKPTPIWAVTLGSCVSRVSSVTWRQLHQRRFFSCLLLLRPQGRGLWVLSQESCEFCKLEVLMSLTISFSPSRKKRRECFSLGKQTLYYWLSKAWQAQEYTENSFKKLMCLCVYVWTHMCMLCESMGTCVPWHIYGARRQFSGVYSTLLCQGISCFYSTARTSYDPQSVLLLLCLGYRVSQHIWLFTWVLGIGFGLSDLNGKFFYPPNHLPTFHLEHSY